MRIKTKLLLILLAVAVTPLFVLGAIRIYTSMELGRDLARRQSMTLMEQAQRLMTVIAEDHARTMLRERQLLETALRYQALAARTRLLGPVPAEPAPVVFSSELDQQARMLNLRRLHARCSWLGQQAAGLEGTDCVDKQVFQLAPGLTRRNAEPDVARLADMDAVYREVSGGLGDIIAWQTTGLRTGLLSVYPGHGQFPEAYDARQSPWYTEALAGNDVVWVPPLMDAASGEVLFTAALAIRDREGRPLAVSAVMAPLNLLLQQNEHTRHLSVNMDAMFLKLENMDGGVSRLRILAQRKSAAVGHAAHVAGDGQWQGFHELRWLAMDAPDKQDYILERLHDGKGGVFQAPHRGTPSLWVFAPVPGDAGVLVFIAPLRDILKDAREATDYLAKRMGEQIIQAVFILGLAIMLVSGLSMLIAKRFTVPLRRLSEAARLISQGDLKARVEVRGQDELADLGRVFNEMGPHIEENFRFREDAELAMQVQQNLLPLEAPKFPGVEVAGVSIYCEKTGGDYYDFFIRERKGEEPCLAVAVGDVSGHGMEAALLMTTARAFLRMRANLPGDPSEVITDVNRYLSRDTLGTGRFMSLFYLEIDPRANSLAWVRAGHDAALVHDPLTGEFAELGGPGLTLGVVGDWKYSASARKGFAVGHIVALGSDGIWETRDPQGHMFGKDRFKDAIRGAAGLPAEDIMGVVLNSLEAFRGEAAQEDDVTLVVVKFG